MKFLMCAFFLEALIIFQLFLIFSTDNYCHILTVEIRDVEQLHGAVRRSGLSLVSRGSRAYVIALIMSMQLFPPSSIIYLIGCFEPNVKITDFSKVIKFPQVSLKMTNRKRTKRTETLDMLRTKFIFIDTKGPQEEILE